MKRYAKDHEWICTDSEGIASIGISEFALRDFGEVNFVELPEIGSVFGRGQAFAVIKSKEASSEVYMPAGGKIVEVNGQLEDFPQIISSDPEGLGWIVKIIPSNPEEIAELMDKEQYLKLAQQDSEE